MTGQAQPKCALVQPVQCGIDTSECYQALVRVRYGLIRISVSLFEQNSVSLALEYVADFIIHRGMLRLIFKLGKAFKKFS